MSAPVLYRPFELKAVTEEGTIQGYGSVFHVQDKYDDIVMPGAFARTLKERMPKMLWQHDPSQPIGVWTSAKEDAHGLHLEGKLVLGVPAADAAHRLLKAGALDGLSIGYRTKVAEFDDQRRVRKLLDVDLWEVSPVTFPANIEARVESVKADLDVRDLEAALRDAGLSRSRAKAVVPIVLAALSDGRRDAGAGDAEEPPSRRDAGAEAEDDGLSGEIRKLAASLR